MSDYLKNPEAIYKRSFELVREATDLTRIPRPLVPLVLRVVHACAMPEIVKQIAFSKGAAERGEWALSRGAPILVDARMTGEGVIRSRLPADNEIVCTLGAPGVEEAARDMNTTRSAAAVELWRPWLGGAVVAIGNAPTALFRLLELLQAGAPKPALVLGFPVGFVGAAESKDALIEAAVGLNVAYVCLRGRLGGSAMAAAAVNALAHPPEGPKLLPESGTDRDGVEASGPATDPS